MAAPAVTRATTRTVSAVRAGLRSGTTWRTLLDRVESAAWLDRLSDPLQRVIQRAVPRPARDALHGVQLGHPLHPAVVMAPIGAWLSAAVLDLTRDGRRAASLLLRVGTASAVPAAVAGINDWASLAPEQRRVGLVHAAVNGVGVGLYVASLVARRRGGDGRLLSYAGLAVAGTSAYVGGHLSYRQAAAVNQAEPLLRRIPGGWHDICNYEDLSAGEPVKARIGEVPVFAIRSGDDVTVMIGRCAHETGPLSDGERIRVDGADCIVCPWHGSTFRLTDGAAMHGPAASSQPCLRARVVAGRVEAALP